MTLDPGSPRLWEQQTHEWRTNPMMVSVRVCVCSGCVSECACVRVAATAGQTGFLRAVVMAAAGRLGPDLLGPAEVSTR